MLVDGLRCCPLSSKAPEVRHGPFSKAVTAERGAVSPLASLFCLTPGIFDRVSAAHRLSPENF